MIEEEIDTSSQKKSQQILKDKKKLTNNNINNNNNNNYNKNSMFIIQKEKLNFENLSPIKPKQKSQSLNSESIDEVFELENKENLKINEEKKTNFNLIPIGIQCRIPTHKNKYISLDKKKLSIICKQCLIEGLAENNIEISSESEIKNLEKNNNLEFCDCNNNEIAYYYCNSCNKFICYQCCINKIHINHEINSINFESNSFKDDIEIELKMLNNLIEALDEIINNNVANKNENVNNDKIHIFKELIKNSNKKINDVIKNIINNFEKKLISNFNKIDEENDNIINSINLIKKKLILNLKELKDIDNILSSKFIENVIKVHRTNKKINIIKNINSLIDQSQKLLNRMKKNTNDFNNFNSTFNKHKSGLLKNLKTFEDNLIHSINTGINSKCFHLNRFKSFQHTSMNYFKTTSIIFNSKNDFNLLGINLCALYIHRKKINDPNFLYDNFENRDNININIKIKKFDNNNNNNDNFILNENKKLFGAVQINDPVYTIYFNDIIKVKNNNDYLITINNIENLNYYNDIWIGATPLNTYQNFTQIIQDNNTNLVIKFTKPEGIQSDFDEFKNGIIEGILFTL